MQVFELAPPDLELYSAVRRDLEHEDLHIHQRISALAYIQAFLFGGFTLVVANSSARVGQSAATHLDNVTKSVCFALTCGLGIASAWVVARSVVRAARAHQIRLEWYRELTELTPEDEKRLRNHLPPDTSSAHLRFLNPAIDDEGNASALRAAIWIPRLLVVLWILLLLLSAYLIGSSA